VKAGVDDNVKAGVDDNVEDGIDVGVGVNLGGGAVFGTGLRTEICTDAGVCAIWGVGVGVFILGFQGEVGLFKFMRSSSGVQVGTFCEF
jgi:hypothetical protein